MHAVKKALRIARSRRKKYAEGGGAFGVYSPGEQAEVDKTDPMSMSVGKSPDDSPARFKTASPMVNITDQDIDRGVNVGMGAGPGIFVGPYGATRLRNMARETGNAAAERALVHPVVGKEIAEEVSRLHPALRETYRSGVQNSRDEWARATLEARAAKGDFNDRDVFAKSGWSFTADGKPAKEIPDLGVKVDPIEGTKDKFSYEHPAGDLHKIYDMPPITRDRNSKNPAYFRYNNGYPEIGVWNDPSKKVGDVGHEVQHLISAREDWPRGSSPAAIPPALSAREHFPGHDLPEYQKDMFIKADRRLNEGKMEGMKSNKPTADIVGYLHSAGENQAFNTQARRSKSFRYLQHPEDTEIVPRAFQSIEYQPPRKAGGGSVGNFNPERASAFGLARQGQIKSTVPGRTDKLELNVPTGSYIIPADIPSALGQGNSDAGSAILNKMFNSGPYGMALPRAKSGMRVGSRKSSLTKTFADGGAAPSATQPQSPWGGGMPGPFGQSMGQAQNALSQSPLGTTFGPMMAQGMRGMQGIFGSLFNRNRPQAPTAPQPQQFRAQMPTMSSAGFGGGQWNGSNPTPFAGRGNASFVAPQQPQHFAEGGEAQEDTPIVAAGGEYVIHPETVMALGAGDIDLGHSILDSFVKQTRAKHITTLKGLKPPKGS